MEASAREEYLVTEVMTATPQKLQLMLIEGAMRFTEKGRMHWRAGERDSASEALIRAQEIVSQILANLNREAAPEMVAKVASIYVCVFRNLVEAALVQDEKKLDDALAVLAVERDTWRELCGKLGSAQDKASLQEYRPAALPLANPGIDALSLSDHTGGLSIDA